MEVPQRRINGFRGLYYNLCGLIDVTEKRGDSKETEESDHGHPEMFQTCRVEM